MANKTVKGPVKAAAKPRKAAAGKTKKKAVKIVIALATPQQASVPFAAAGDKRCVNQQVQTLSVTVNQGFPACHPVTRVFVGHFKELASVLSGPGNK